MSGISTGRRIRIALLAIPALASLAACQGSGAGTSPMGSPVQSVVGSPTERPSAVLPVSTRGESVAPASPSEGPGVHVSAADGTRAYLVDPGITWTEPEPFKLPAGLYHVTGQCGESGGRPGGLTVLLQQVRPTDEAVEQEYRWGCGPAESTARFGELRRLDDGLYRVLIADNTGGGTVAIGPAAADMYLAEATEPPPAPVGAMASASVVPCPTGIDYGPVGPQAPCVVFLLSWSIRSPAATYRVYESWRMPGTPMSPCDSTVVVSIDTGGGLSALTGVYIPVKAQGTCFWVAAANKAGESARVPVAIYFP
jgi:hypothetical protein